MNNLTDVMQYWLQGQINDAVAGHSSRIAYLEDRINSLSKHLVKLEKAYPDMATTKDLQKDTRPEVLMDKLQPLIEQLIRNELEECVSATETAAQPPSDDDKLDALRYRWLRDQHWSDGIVTVVNNPKNNVMIGTQCYSGGLLDAFIDERLQK